MALFSEKKGRYIDSVPLVDIHSAGKCVGKYRDKNIYIDFGIPGETVDIRLERNQRGFYSGSIEHIQIASSKRVSPFCKHFGICGGCNWQHIDYKEQLRLKKQILEKALNKYHIATPGIEDLFPCEHKIYYRNKVEYAFASEYSHVKSEIEEYDTDIKTLGFHPYDRRSQVINIEECWLQSQPSRKICETIYKIAIKNKVSFYHYSDKTGLLRNLVIRISSKGEILVIVGFCYDDPEKRTILLRELQTEVAEITSLMFTILTSPQKGYADGDIILFAGSYGYLNETIGAVKYQISPKTFFQPNAPQTFQIYQKVLEFASLQGNELVYDLYTGAGTIACFIASRAGKVIGIEGSAEAVNDATCNARINGITNAKFIRGDVLRTFNIDFILNNGKPDIIILDPPRSGTLIEIKKTIVQSSPNRIIYLSCNPVSLAFDLTMLTNGYRVVKVQPFDMFPHTHHFETLVLLEKD